MFVSTEVILGESWEVCSLSMQCVITRVRYTRVTDCQVCYVLKVTL